MLNGNLLYICFHLNLMVEVFITSLQLLNTQFLTDAITIPAAVKPGHEFLGWFNNSEFSGNPLTTIPKGSMGNLKFFANFVYFT